MTRCCGRSPTGDRWQRGLRGGRAEGTSRRRRLSAAPSCLITLAQGGRLWPDPTRSEVEKMATDRQKIETALNKGNGVLRLVPCWVPRSFCIPGKRLKLQDRKSTRLNSSH